MDGKAVVWVVTGRLRASGVSMSHEPSLLGQSPFPWFASFDVLRERPGRVVELLNKTFVVTRPWHDAGDRSLSGRQVLESWPCGTRGIVVGIEFTGRLDWVVRAERIGSSAELEYDEVYPTFGLAAFLRATAPLDPKNRWIDLCAREAANDA